jgi:hypothetical protein
MNEWTVWVGGGEVNDHLLTFEEASEVLEEYKQRGYEDATIERIKE